MDNHKNELIDFDREHIWHPYSSMQHPSKMQLVKSADGVYIELEDGTKLIDGMSSWWSVIHGYNVPELNEAVTSQLGNMSHVMFGGLTHEPAISLAKRLVEITDDSLQYVFFSDSGSVSVEVAIKMAFQYWHGRGNSRKTKLLSLKKGYHGDTFGAMSVCDPLTGMHGIFNDILHQNLFTEAPQCGFNDEWNDAYITDIKASIETHHEEIAAVILEPIVQGAGGMRIYSPEYLRQVKALCDEYDLLLIFDEVATGFGRTGRLFAYEHAGVVPDILCVGKALTGGYMSLAATITNEKVVKGVESNNNILMHGPTFMGNPLACSVAERSLQLLLDSPWQERVRAIETQLRSNLEACETLEIVKEVRVLGAIGVVELHKNVDMAWMTPEFIREGVWIRPFLNLVYIMPPFVIRPDELKQLTSAIYNVIENFQNRG
ncbi:MAG: adenosylmethionine--8-amino-7-oxononanoate transaminase [Campylobacterota bacterium]|nr:adenosylmethionine--8-amino-7-oxononanoate transaminase [Campylobacterota bacterium]